MDQQHASIMTCHAHHMLLKLGRSLELCIFKAGVAMGFGGHRVLLQSITSKQWSNSAHLQPLCAGFI
jgi:hypothetical protein